MAKPYQLIAQRKRARLHSLIPPDWRLRLPYGIKGLPRDLRPLISSPGNTFLTSAELDITNNYDATSLSRLIHTGALSSEAVTTAFCKRASIAQQLTNCLSEILFQPAMERARGLDAEFARTGKTRGPLHGIPISLKDTFNLKGYDSTCGLAALAEKPATQNATLVDILLEAGAVPFCKTNVSQTLMALDSHNHLFGRTLNPCNTALTAGGSSGGEGALIALRGSVLGVGTDIGGSIRIPAMCNGIYGIKPSTGRVPFSGVETGQPEGLDKLGLKASAGPMATSVRDCKLFLDVIAQAKPWERDPDVVFEPWESKGELPQKPVFGVLRTDGVTTPLPPVSRALDETVEVLRREGIDVVEVDAPGFEKCPSLANAFFAIDGNNHTFDYLEKTEEPLIPWLDARLSRREKLNLHQIKELHVRKAALEKAMLEALWKDESGRRIDALICPVAPHPVPETDRWNGVGYTSVFVLLDYPAGTVPVRDFGESDLGLELASEERVRGGWDKRNRALWDPETVEREVYLNSPLSVQVVAPRLQERKLLQAMALVANLF